MTIVQKSAKNGPKLSGSAPTGGTMLGCRGSPPASFTLGSMEDLSPRLSAIEGKLHQIKEYL